jgi:hypothetical protein
MPSGHAVEAAGETRTDPVHRLCERIVLPDLEEQMHVIGHEAVIVEPQREAVARLLEDACEQPEAWRREQELTIVAAQCDMMDGSGV